MSAPSLSVERLGKRYALNGSPFWALKDVALEADAGDVIGVLGRNGAGKTTLLRILARITEPSEGRARLWGRVGCLLETGTGFHEELTGRENVFVNGAVLGMRPSEIRAKFDEIVDFAGVGNFIDAPVKHFSSGMRVRLAFSVAAHLDADILLVDEVLAVGDLAFQEKCLRKMDQISSTAGRTVLFVSHDVGAVQTLCTRAVMLDAGRVVREGKPEDVIQAYRAAMLGPHGRADLRALRDRAGSGVLRFVDLRLEDLQGRPLSAVPAGGAVRLLLDYETTAAAPSDVYVNVVFIGARGQRLFGAPSDVLRCDLTALGPKGTLVCELPRLPLVPGLYDLLISCRVDRDLADKFSHACTVAVADGDYYLSGRLPPSRNGDVLIDYRWSLRPPTA